MAKTSIDLTSLCSALSQRNIAAADMIAAHCSKEQLRTLLRRDPDTGRSTFSDLLINRTRKTIKLRGFQELDKMPKLDRTSDVSQTPEVRSFQWLATRGGAHFHPSCFTEIIGRARPSSRIDQAWDKELFRFMLDTFSDQVDTEDQRTFLLHQASINSHAKIVDLLVKRNFDVDVILTSIGSSPVTDAIGGLTTLDIVSFTMAGPGATPSIAQGTLYDQLEWQKDIEMVKAILARHSRHSEDYHIGKVHAYIAGIEEHLTKSGGLAGWAKQLDSSGKDALAGVKRRQESVISWPAPIPYLDSSSSHSIPSSINTSTTTSSSSSIHNARPGHARPTDSGVADVWDKVANPKVRRERLRELKEQARATQEALGPGFMEKVRSVATSMKLAWRLPPHWKVIGSVQIEEDQGPWRPLFQDCRTDIMTFEKPALWRGEEVASPESGEGSQAAIWSTPALRLRAKKDSVTELYTSLDCHKIQPMVESFRTLGMGTRGHSPAENALDYFDDKGNTIMHLCAAMGLTEGVERLLSQIPELERENNNGLTALQVAVSHARLDIVRVLLDHGAQPDRLFADIGLLPLHVSTTHKDPRVAQLLLNAGANPDGESVDGTTALHFCLSNGDNAEMVQVLIDGGADVNMLVGTATPLSVAVVQSRQASLKTLLSAGAAMNATHDPEHNESLLHMAARQDDVRVAEILLDHGADVNKRDQSSKTPIIDAVLCTHYDMIKLLFSRGADAGVILEFQFFRRTREDGKIDRLFIHIGDGEPVSAEQVGQGEGDQYVGWEEWEPVKVNDKKE